MKSSFVFFLITLLKTTDGFCQNGSKIISYEPYTPTTSAKAKEYYNNGHDYILGQNFREAVEALSLAIDIDPDYVDAYDDLSLAYRQINRLDSAEYFYLISHQKYPLGTVAIKNMAIVEERRGHYKKADEYYNKALAVNSKDPEIYYGLSKMYLMLKMFHDALDNGNTAEKYYKQMDNPHMGDLYGVLCTIHYMLNNSQLARKYMGLAQEAGIKIDPQISGWLETITK